VKEWLWFIASIADELFDLFGYVTTAAKSGQFDPERERQIALAIVRKASDEQMRRELGG
jgi:hypothetical protein